jgi:hypothetical protein
LWQSKAVTLLTHGNIVAKVRYKSIAFIALVLWLLGNWLGTHGHFCFDGQEPMVSVHVHLDQGEHDHHDDEVHQDADLDLSQLAPAKVNKVDLGLILLATLSLLLVIVPCLLFNSIYRCSFPSFGFYYRPPLRAPPLPA